MKKINILLILIIVMSFTAASCSKEKIHPEFYYIKTINVIKWDGTPTNKLWIHKYSTEINETKKSQVKFYIECDEIHILKGKRPDFQSGYTIAPMPDGANPERDTVYIQIGELKKGITSLGGLIEAPMGHQEIKFLGETN